MDKEIYYFYLGRNAIYAVLKLLKISSNDEVLTPAWDCDAALQPFRAVGCKMVFYKTHPYTFEIDLNHVQTLISEKTKLIHIVNHFGQPQDWGKILLLRNEVNVPILEDNAYSYLSGINGKAFGGFGDFSIFSLRKHLPILDGGALYINSSIDYHFKGRRRWLYPEQYGLAKNLFIKRPIYRLVSLIKVLVGLRGKSILGRPKIFEEESNTSNNEYWFPLYSNGKKQFPPGERDLDDNSFYCDYERPISLISRILLGFYTFGRLRRTRKRKIYLYNFLVEKLSDIKSLKIIHPKLQDSVVPYCLSFLIGKNRDDILYKLEKKKYPVWVWPSLPIEVLNNLKEFPEVDLLGRHLMQIILKTNLDQEVYENLVHDLKSLLSHNEVLNFEYSLDWQD